MGRRPAVTFEQVAAIANELVARGLSDPGPRSIREELTKRAGPAAEVGSFGTIQRHLGKWRTHGRPIDPPLALPDLPAQLSVDMRRALSAAAQEARGTSERRVAQLEAELTELATSCEGYEARMDALADDLAAMTTARDVMAGRFQAQMSDSERLSAALRSDAEVREEQRLELAATRAHLAALETQRAAAIQDRDELRVQLAALQTETRALRDARAMSEHEAGMVKVQLAAAHEALTRSEQRASELQLKALDLEPWLARCVGAESAATELRKQVDVLSSLIRRRRPEPRQDQQVHDGDRARGSPPKLV